MLDFVRTNEDELRLVVDDPSTRTRIAEKAGVKSGADVVRVLEATAASLGCLFEAVGDMAMEFMSDEARQWDAENGVTWIYLSGRRRGAAGKF
jgi:maltoporin